MPDLAYDSTPTTRRGPTAVTHLFEERFFTNRGTTIFHRHSHTQSAGFAALLFEFLVSLCAGRHGNHRRGRRVLPRPLQRGGAGVCRSASLTRAAPSRLLRGRQR